jgi:hypothetical protein
VEIRQVLRRSIPQDFFGARVAIEIAPRMVISIIAAAKNPLLDAAFQGAQEILRKVTS